MYQLNTDSSGNADVIGATSMYRTYISRSGGYGELFWTFYILFIFLITMKNYPHPPQPFLIRTVYILQVLKIPFLFSKADGRPDAWMDQSKNKVGYEINFTKYFYKYKPLHSMDEITHGLLKRKV